VIVGSKEMKKGSVTLRDMTSGEQTLVPVDGIGPEISRRMG
jgi:histidyl-tRNA synthetase